MNTRVVTDKDEWNKLLLEKSSSFLQSWQWGGILEATGQKVERLLVEDDKVLAQAQVVYKPLPFGWKYALCPKGPVVFSEGNENKVYQALLDYLKKQGCIFFRVEPEKEVNGQEFVVKDTEAINPRATLVLSLDQSEEQLTGGMEKNTRYSIRTATKQELELTDEKDLGTFWELMKKTASHSSFRTHPKKHYEKILQSEASFQLSAKLNDKVIATAIFIGFGDTFTYLFAASDREHKKTLAPYFVQWQGIKLAKSLGYKHYDFFGVAPRTSSSGDYEYDRKHAYGGITKFKLGFGGEFGQAVGTVDLVIESGKYGTYKVLRKLRKILRR